jgi:hypothetical protein
MSNHQYFGWELDLMREYVQKTELWMNEAYREHSDSIRCKIKGLKPDEAVDIINYGAEADMLLTDVYPTISSSWTFVSIVSYVEHELVYLCRWIEIKQKGSHSFYPRNGVLDCCKAQMKALGLAPPTGGASWQELKIFQDIRNVIVHRLGEVDNNDETGRDRAIYRAIYSYVAKRSDIEVSFHRLKTTHEFCLHAIAVVKEFINQLEAIIPPHLLDLRNRRR